MKPHARASGQKETKAGLTVPDGLAFKWTISNPHSNLGVAFDQTARLDPAKAAVFWGETTHTYGELLHHARQVGHRLRNQLQLQPGDRVAIWMRNRPEFVSSVFGILMADGVIVPINNFLKPEEVAFILRDSGARIIISEQASVDSQTQLRSLAPDVSIFQVEEVPIESGSPSDPLAPLRRDHDLAVLAYTSGTTGKPKGAMLTHRNLLSNVESCRQMLEAVALDRFVILLPMFHSFMLCVGILLPMTTGCSVVVIKSLHPPKNVIQEILAHQPTILPAIPQFFRALANVPLPAGFPLRLCISGAAPLPAEILREFNAKVQIPLIEGYGLTEASPVVSLNPIRGPWKSGSVGIPIPGVEMSIQDDNARVLPDGESGELCVRGENVMAGYWNLPEETSAAIRDAWLLTGDLGYRDPDGYYFITDRKKDMLLVNGINVYPREVEEALYAHPSVKEAAVVGIPDAKRGEQPVAFVVFKDGVSPDEKALLQFIRDKLADYKVPRRLHSMNALPRNATGKVLKTELRDAARSAGN